MGFKTFGFGGGRKDVWEPEELYWCPRGLGWRMNATAASASFKIPSPPCKWA